MPLSPKIKVALQAMENMGFNNDNNWLSDLLMKYDGDIVQRTKSNSSYFHGL